MPTNAMRYLSSISLALIVNVLLSIVVMMALACTSTASNGPMPADEQIYMQPPDLQATIRANVEVAIKEIATVTPRPTYTQYPTYTPQPTYTRYPTYTPGPVYQETDQDEPIFSQTEVNDMVFDVIFPCLLKSSELNVISDWVSRRHWETRYLGENRWLVTVKYNFGSAVPSASTATVDLGKWRFDERTAEVISVVESTCAHLGF